MDNLQRLINDHDVHSIDLKYCDLIGNWYHITFPVRRLERVLIDGIPFDGSSIPGMRSVESGDMILLPDPETAILDPFTTYPTVRMLCYICDADTRAGVGKDPRSVAQRTAAYMESTGIADESYWIPEFEFYLFDDAEITNTKYRAGYAFTSAENKENLPEGYVDRDGTASAFRKAYHIDPPFDKHADVREEMVRLIEDT